MSSIEIFNSAKIYPGITRICGLSGELMYLVQGTNRAVLIDTGCGAGSLKDYIKQLTDKPVTVVLTHGHVDHAMGAPEFEDVYMNSADNQVYQEHCDMNTRKEYLEMTNKEKFNCLKETDYIPVKLPDYKELNDGQVFDLGGLTLEVLAVPGHTPGSMAVLLVEPKLLLLGDACNYATFLWDEHTLGITSYEKALKRLKDKTDGRYLSVLLSHGDGDAPKEMLDSVIEVCESIKDGTADDVPFEFMGHTAHMAKAVNEDRKRVDGGIGNIIYDKRREILQKLTTEEKVALCTGANQWKTKEYMDLAVPLVMSDGTNGVRFQIDSDKQDVLSLFDSFTARFDTKEAIDHTNEATCFPAGSSLACTWDVNLAKEIGSAIAMECKRLGIGLLLGPGMNTRRHPLSARNFEYYSEDPCLSGEMAVGMVQGVQEEGVGTCVKHFACNNSEYKRTKIDSVVEERALREIYLAGFERVIKKAAPAAIMGSYNKLNGVQACESSWLLQDVLRKDWGYQGAVISDWGAVKDNKRAFLNGLDLKMPHSENYIKEITQAVESGEIDEAVLDEHCARMIHLAQLYSREGKDRPEVNFDEHHKLAQKAACEAAVLLKNENHILPITGTAPKKIAVLGNLAVHPQYQGTGCAIIRSKSVDIPLEEMKNNCNDNIQLIYKDGYNELHETNSRLLQEACEAAAEADAAVVFAGAFLPGESDDYNRKNMDIEKSHQLLIEEVSKVQKHLIVVLYNCEAVAMPWENRASAILTLWMSGEGSGKAVADLLFGKANPCGKLPVTMPVKLSDTPAYLNFPGESGAQIYSEGIFVGYRYYEKKELKPLFPFGHGLSYTEFVYSNLTLSEERLSLPDTLCVSLQVTNTGSYAGKEIVQLYVADDHGKLKRPIKELKGFQKIELEPMETKLVTFTLDKRDFAYYDSEFGDWVVDSGNFDILVGSASNDIRLEGHVWVISNQVYQSDVATDTLFSELIENPQAADLFFDYLVDRRLLTREQVTAKLKEAAVGTFWGLSVFMEMNAPGKISKQEMMDLVDKINQICK